MKVLLVAGPLGLLAIAGSFIHPFGAVRDQRADTPLFAGAEISPSTAQIFERSCQNCHSERTVWPWYSHAAPVSWAIERDVAGGREHMNLSRWDSYTFEQQMQILSRVGAEVRNRRMPVPQYVYVHPEAKLSDGDVKQLYDWAHRERRRLRGLVKAKSNWPLD